MPALHPMQQPLSMEQLHNAMKALLPLDLNAYPYSYAEHVLRVWGMGASFPNLNLGRQDFAESWSQTVRTGLLNNDAYRMMCGNIEGNLLIPSEIGVQILCKDDGGYGSAFTSAHAGGYLELMADMTIPTNESIVAADHQTYSFAAIVRDEAYRVTPSVELEWIVGGLARYLNSARWSNRFGSIVSFDDLVPALIQRGHDGVGVCHGCHIPYALATLLAVGRNLVSEASHQRIQDELRRLRDVVSEQQLSDGSWDRTWRRTKLRYANVWSTDVLERISITGHIIEYFSILPSEFRPADDDLRSAAVRLLDLIVENPDVRVDWYAHAPLSHAVKSLLGISGYWQAATIPGIQTVYQATR